MSEPLIFQTLEAAAIAGRVGANLVELAHRLEDFDREAALLTAAKRFRIALDITGAALNEHRQRERRRKRMTK